MFSVTSGHVNFVLVMTAREALSWGPASYMLDDRLSVKQVPRNILYIICMHSTALRARIALRRKDFRQATAHFAQRGSSIVLPCL